MENVIAMASILVAVVSGLTEVVKRMEIVKNKFLPLVSLIIGVVAGLAATLLFDESTVTMVWAGGIAGLASCGLYDGLKIKIGGNE